MQLNRPVRELGGLRTGCGPGDPVLTLPVENCMCRAGTDSACGGSRRQTDQGGAFLIAARLDGRLNRLFIKSFRFTLFNRQGSFRTITDAGAQSVAVHIAYQFRLAVYDLDRFFGAAGHAQTTTVTLFFVNFDDLSNHILFYPNRFFLMFNHRG